MLCWVNSVGDSFNKFTNKRKVATTTSAVVGKLSSVGELANLEEQVQQADGAWLHFRALAGSSFWVRSDVCEYVMLESQPSVQLDITYHSQNDGDSKFSYNDCGPASSCMMLERAGIHVRVDDFMRVAGITHKGFTGFEDNMHGVAAYGLKAQYKRPFQISEIITELQRGNPVFSLIRYSHLIPGKDYGHFIVTVGYYDENSKLYMVIHDPNNKPNMAYEASVYGAALTYAGSPANMGYQSYVITNYPDSSDNTGNPADPPVEPPVELPVDPPADPPTESPTETPVDPPVVDPVGEFDDILLGKLDVIIGLLNDIFSEL